MLQAELEGRDALQITLHETVVVSFQVEGRRAGFVDPGDSIRFMERQDAENPANGGLALPLVQGLSERSDIGPFFRGAGQELYGSRGCTRRAIRLLNTMPAALLAQMFT